MGLHQSPAYRRLGIAPVDFPGAISIATKSFYVVGHKGDFDPGARYSGDIGNTLVNVAVTNITAAGHTLYVALHEAALGCLGRYYPLAPNETITYADLRALARQAGDRWPGDDQLVGVPRIVVFNPDATNVGAIKVLGDMIQLPNWPKNEAGADSAGHPGLGPELSALMFGEDSATYTWEVVAPWNLTVTGCSGYADKQPSTGGTFVLDVEDELGRKLVDGFDLTGLTAAPTPGTPDAISLTSDTVIRDIDQGGKLICKAIASTTVTNKDFALLFTATKR